MTYEQFVEQWEFSVVPYKKQDIRLGQSLMSYLNTVRPDLYKHIVVTQWDCFYIDAVIPHTLKQLKILWEY